VAARHTAARKSEAVVSCYDRAEVLEAPEQALDGVAGVAEEVHE